MAETAREIIRWLETLAGDELVGVDDGGLTLCTDAGTDGPYLEIGGIEVDDDYK